VRTELLNSFYPAGDFIERPNVHDVERIGGQVFVATSDGVFAASLGQRREFIKIFQFRAEALCPFSQKKKEWVNIICATIVC